MHGNKFSLMETNGSLKASLLLMKVERARRKLEDRLKYLPNGSLSAILNLNMTFKVLRKMLQLELRLLERESN